MEFRVNSLSTLVMALVSERFVLPVSEQNGRPKLLVAVKRYTSPSFPPPRRGLTLLLTHGVTFHKELWEPTLSRLFELQSHPNSPVRIREAWAIDCPNHGESAALNDYVLSLGYLITFQDYTRAVTAFLASGLLDLHTHHLVGIGHSAGSAPLAAAAEAWNRRTGDFPFISLMMLEPSMISAELDAKYNHFNASLAAKAQRRRSRWSSREEAAQWFRKRQRLWDPRCSTLYAEYGLRSTRGPSREVILSCTGAQEAACYSVEEQEESLAVLKRLCALLPVHTIFAEFVDLSPHPEVQDNLVDARKGRRMASVTHMRSVGHFAPFESPEISARAIFHCLYLLRGYASSGSRGRTHFAEARL